MDGLLHRRRARGTVRARFLRRPVEGLYNLKMRWDSFSADLTGSSYPATALWGASHGLVHDVSPTGVWSGQSRGVGKLKRAAIGSKRRRMFPVPVQCQFITDCYFRLEHNRCRKLLEFTEFSRFRQFRPPRGLVSGDKLVSRSRPGPQCNPPGTL